MKKAMEKGTGYASKEIVRIQKLMMDKSVQVTRNPPGPETLNPKFWALDGR